MKGANEMDGNDNINNTNNNNNYNNGYGSYGGGNTQYNYAPGAGQWGNPYAQQAYQGYKPQKPRRTFTVFEFVFAWLCFAAGYIFWRVFPVSSNPLGGFIFVILLFAATIVMLKKKGVKFRSLPLIAAASAIVVSLTFIFSANGFLQFFALLYILAVYCYFIYALCGSVTAAGFSGLILIDFIKALFVLPFYSFGELFRAMFSGKAKGSGKILLKLIIGIGAAIIPLSVVIALLSYDEKFVELMLNIFSFNIKDILSHMLSLGLAIPVGMYLFGLFISSTDQKCENILSADTCKETSDKIKIVPVLTVLTAVIPLLLVYVVFFISQWEYYVSAFTGKLPESLSYAEYARAGFFQLCIVSFINLLVIVAVILFMRRRTDHPTVTLKILSILYSVFTLVLISTAVAKMVMYIDCYGLTQKRVYATWFMAVLAAVFLIILIKQFVPKFNAVAVSLAAFVVLFAVLCVSNVDAFIAKYNVDRYIDGKFKTVDVEEIVGLGDAGIPELVRLYDEVQYQLDSGNSNVQRRLLHDELVSVLKESKAHYESDKRSIFSVTVPYVRAQKALENVDLNKGEQ